MIDDLAEYEQVPGPVRSTAESLHAVMFGPAPILFGFIARICGEPAGIILGYETYSTFAANKKLFIEDLFVRPEHRGGGTGRALIAAFAKRCLARGYAGVQWRVLEANAPAIRFYQSIGTVVSTEHRNCSLAGPALRAFADSLCAKPALRFADTDGRMLSRSI
jgi:GNAT superfamily N-acetyltransferase